jgi:D-amino peptidase
MEDLMEVAEMKQTVLALACALAVGPTLSGQSADDLKVFISVDMEGITGVVHWEEVSRTGKDYDYFRAVMTKETNAAIEGAVAAGATEIVVRDSHGSARNILPELLDQRARLLRDWSGSHMSMMEGIDGSFDAVVFIGYHAMAGTPNALLEHTSSGNVTSIQVNGVALPEAGYNALVAGHFGVPVVFTAGDRAICDQVTQLFGEVETVAVKEGIGGAALNLHPQVARERIRAGVEHALNNLDRFQPYRLTAPYTLVVTLKDETLVHNGSFYPGVERTGDWELTFRHDDLMEIIKAWMFMRRM